MTFPASSTKMVGLLDFDFFFERWLELNFESGLRFAEGLVCNECCRSIAEASSNVGWLNEVFFEVFLELLLLIVTLLCFFIKSCLEIELSLSDISE